MEDDSLEIDKRIRRPGEVDIHSLVPPLPQYKLEESEFEKEIKQKDFT